LVQDAGAGHGGRSWAFAQGAITDLSVAACSAAVVSSLQFGTSALSAWT